MKFDFFAPVFVPEMKILKNGILTHCKIFGAKFWSRSEKFFCSAQWSARTPRSWKMSDVNESNLVDGKNMSSNMSSENFNLNRKQMALLAEKKEKLELSEIL